jgi:hypothetical protein
MGNLLRGSRAFAIGACVFGFALGASAGPAMYNASLIFHSWGNDITTGTAPPLTMSTFTGAPLGHDCQHATPHTPYDPRYCSEAVIEAGAPATGPRPGGPQSISTTAAGVGGGIIMPQSALGITTTGFLATYYPYLQSNTYATFVNDAGNFFAGGGPAAGLGQKIKTGMGQVAGTWVINEGKNGFGGVMGILGKYGAKAKYVVPSVAGTYIGTGTWDMLPPAGRNYKSTPTAFTAMGKATNWLNPHVKTNAYLNTYNGKKSTLVARGTGTPWTTGSVTLYATAGVFSTVLHRAGYDTVTGSGARNIQLVTPELTHWIGPGYQTHSGQMGILKLQIAPEPGSVLLLAAGGAVLALLYRVSRRR